jgi:hypothetical protein
MRRPKWNGRTGPSSFRMRSFAPAAPTAAASDWISMRDWSRMRWRPNAARNASSSRYEY